MSSLQNMVTVNSNVLKEIHSSIDKVSISTYFGVTYYLIGQKTCENVAEVRMCKTFQEESLAIYASFCWVRGGKCHLGVPPSNSTRCELFT